MIVHKGQAISEAFQNGWEASKPHPLASGTKSFWGLLAVAAVEDDAVEPTQAMAWGFARTLANEVAADGITVNNVLPGYTATERLNELARAAVPSFSK